MVLRQIDFDKHDSTMVFLQGLPHLVNRVVTHVFAETGIDLETLLAIATANSRLFLLANGRTFVQRSEISDTLISSGLRTPEGQKLVQTLKESINTFVQAAASGELAAILEQDANLLDPTGTIRTRLNVITTDVLKYLAEPRTPVASPSI